MTVLRAAAQPFEPSSAHRESAPQPKLLLTHSEMLRALLEIDSVYLDYGVQSTIRNKCLNAAPWLQATGLPRDTMGLMTVLLYYRDVSLNIDKLLERNEYLEEHGRQADQTTELQRSLFRDQHAELERLVSKGQEQAETEACLQQQLRAARVDLAQEQEAHNTTREALAETQESTGVEIAHLYAERERLSACLEEQHRECAHLTKAAATAKEASAHDLSAAQTQAEEASLAGATMADALRECRQQLALAQQQTIKSAQEASAMAQQLADAESAMGQYRHQAAQQMADFHAHVYEVLGQLRAQHQSHVEGLMRQLAEQRVQISELAESADLAQAAADAADQYIVALQAAAAHRNAELAGMQQAAEAQAEELAGLQILVACQGVAARDSKLQSRQRLALLFSDTASLKARQSACKASATISQPATEKPVTPDSRQPPALHCRGPPQPAFSQVLQDVSNHRSATAAASTLPGSRQGNSTPAAQMAGRTEPAQQKKLQPESHRSLSPPPNSGRGPSTVAKRNREADDAAKIARLSQDVEWGFALQLSKRLQRKLTAQLHREWD